MLFGNIIVNIISIISYSEIIKCKCLIIGNICVCCLLSFDFKYLHILSKNNGHKMESGSSEIVSIFHKQPVENLARVKLFVFIYQARCEVLQVGF